MTGIYWFRNDLRISDNPSFHRAVSECDTIIPVFIFDHRWWEVDEWGMSRTGPYRTKFLIESVAQLQEALRALKVELQVRSGDSAECMVELAKTYKASKIFAQTEHTRDERIIEAEIARQIPLMLTEGHTLFHPDDIPFELNSLPDVFTEFRKALEKKTKVRASLSKPSFINTPELPVTLIPSYNEFKLDHPPFDSRAALAFKGGASAAWKRLDHYFWQSKRLSFYKQTRNGLIGADYSSKFSPWLANGSISAREIYHEVKHYEAEHGANQSTYWLVFELIWRDYFRFVAMKYGTRIFQMKGIKAAAPRWHQDQKAFAKWKEGKTGDGFVDANMKELVRTGWMSNRGRQNVASYLVHDLGLDWRMGASFFEHYLLDHDPCSNYGNWIYVAGVGNDPRPNRKFNTRKQAEMYDANGKFQQRWNNEVLEFDL